MKQIKYLISIAILTFGVISCQKKDVVSSIEAGEKRMISPDELELSAEFSTSNKSKVTYTQDDIYLVPEWELNDVIVAFDDDGKTYSLRVYKIVEEEGLKIAKLKINKEVADGTTLHAIYNVGFAESGIQDKKAYISYDNQKGTESMPAVMLADAKIEENHCRLEFHNAGSVVGICNVNGVPKGRTIKSVEINGEQLSAAKIALNEEGKLALSIFEDTPQTPIENYLTLKDLNFKVIGDNGELDKPIYIAVPAGSKLCTIDLYLDSTEDYFYTYNSASLKTVVANKFITIKEQVFSNEFLPGIHYYSEADGAYTNCRFSRGLVKKNKTTGEYSFFDKQYEFDNNPTENNEYQTCFNWNEACALDVRGMNLGAWLPVVGALFGYSPLRYEVNVCGAENSIVIFPETAYTGSKEEAQRDIAGEYDESTWAEAERNGAICFVSAGSISNGVYSYGYDGKPWIYHWTATEENGKPICFSYWSSFNGRDFGHDKTTSSLPTRLIYKFPLPVRRRHNLDKGSYDYSRR